MLGDREGQRGEGKQWKRRKRARGSEQKRRKWKRREGKGRKKLDRVGDMEGKVKQEKKLEERKWQISRRQEEMERKGKKREVKVSGETGGKIRKGNEREGKKREGKGRGEKEWKERGEDVCLGMCQQICFESALTRPTLRRVPNSSAESSKKN